MIKKTMMLAGAGALAVAFAMPAQARSLTSSPEATMHEQQKLGPNVVTTQMGNRFITERVGPNTPYRGPMTGPVYGYSPGYELDYHRDGYTRSSWGPSYSYGYGSNTYYPRGYPAYGYGPGIGLSVGIY